MKKSILEKYSKCGGVIGNSYERICFAESHLPEDPERAITEINTIPISDGLPPEYKSVLKRKIREILSAAEKEKSK